MRSITELFCKIIIISIEICACYCFPAEVEGSNERIRYQMDVELLRFENLQGLEVYGMPCDPLKQGCDTRIFAYMDWIKPDDEWPGSRELEQDDTVYEASDPTPTSFDIRKTFMTQLCGNHTKNVTLRVKVQDDDKIFRGTDDLIGNFNCRFPIFPVHENETIAEWTKPASCEPVRHRYYEPVATLTYRTKIYFVEGECM